MGNLRARTAARTRHRCGGALATMMTCALAWAAPAAEGDICENKTGAQLIRCIEAAARSPGAPRAADDPKAPTLRPAQRPTPPVPPAAETVTPQAEKPATISRPPAADRKASPEDCTGRAGEALRRCLAAGGRLAPDAAANAAGPARADRSRSEGCEHKSGEALRRCIEAQSKNGALPRAVAHAEVIPCTGYTASDQPLCVHRNSAIVECRNPRLYPDFEVCLRSHMANAPEPPQADCSKFPSRARGHCETRNRVYSACSTDRLGYFACLERQLGPDAVLARP